MLDLLLCGLGLIMLTATGNLLVEPVDLAPVALLLEPQISLCDWERGGPRRVLPRPVGAKYMQGTGSTSAHRDLTAHSRRSEKHVRSR